MRRNEIYMGKLECLVEGGELVAGMPNTLRLKYTAGKYGIDDGGYIWFFRRGITDWQELNLCEKKALGYTSISSNADVELTVDTPDGIRPYETAIRVRVRGGCLKEGDFVELVIGDKTHGSSGSLVQTVAEKNHMIFAAIDSIGGNRLEEAGSPVYIDIKNGGISDFDIVMPSTVRLNELFYIHIRVMDDYGNRCNDFTGEIRLGDLPDGIEVDSIITLNPEDNGCKKIAAKIKKHGIYRIKADLRKYGLHKSSNACKTISENENKLFWGDIHGQNSMASGIGSMDDVLTFSKEMAVLDFTSWQGNDFEISDNNWEDVKKAISTYHKDHEFIVFNGYEWSGITANGGDHNIIFLGDNAEIHRSSKWCWKNDGRKLPVGSTDDGSDCNPISELWDVFKGRNDVMAIPHVGGRYGNFDFFNEELISLIEIYSHHGIFEWFLEDAVKRRMKVGFIATSDDHTSRVGLSYPMRNNASDVGASFDVKSGLTAVYAKELSRQGIWDALKKRRCYASTSSRMILEFKCNGYEMGEEISLSEFPDISVSVHGSAPIDKVEVYRDLDLVLTNKLESAEECEIPKKIKIVWSGVRTKFRKKSVRWDGSVYIKGGMITNASNYSIDNDFDGIQSFSKHIVNFRSKTSGDEDGMIIDIIPDSKNECEIIFVSEQGSINVTLGEIARGDKTFEFGGVNQKVEFSLTTEKKCFDVTTSFTDSNVKKGLNIYYVKVFQTDGNRAWSSPIFVNYSN